jgi:trans-aconitate methyltransferase
MSGSVATSRQLLRHFLGAIAYRTQKALRGAPAGFGEFRIAATTRTPHELVWHMTGVIGYARTMLHGGSFRPARLEPFDEEVRRFHDTLSLLGADFADDALTASISDEQFLQGPLADAMTHAGQLAMLRRLAGSPVASENFIFADVKADRLGIAQPDPAAPDAWWTAGQGPLPPGQFKAGPEGGPPPPRFYDELAEWWPLFSPPEHYVEEAADLLERLPHASSSSRQALLELGCGGGSLASHLKSRFALTLTDRSASMLAVSRRVNPESEHIVGDMRTLRLKRQFDVVLVHDAIMYAVTPEDVLATLQTAAAHCQPAGAVVVIPDYVRETFTPGTGTGGGDAADGRGFRYLEWRWDPNPLDDTYVVDYAFMMREVTGAARVVHDRHVEGLFARASWLQWFRAAGLVARSEIDRWGRDVFVARAG